MSEPRPPYLSGALSRHQQGPGLPAVARAPQCRPGHPRRDPDVGDRKPRPLDKSRELGERMTTGQPCWNWSNPDAENQVA
ncbi:hypothetical protein NDU88_000370 [Pleurodeles waltl]|uniref:Uncharacterized protein n=1 Tax=Pleurodeles waltl TaxID=8319 RepID=A0AAV7KXQ6_PLEWA|nr:hypothetical protein NDU88_000370 [Pleurodeles waltl]